MRQFKINNAMNVVCNSSSSRNGFNHICTLFVNGQERESAKAHYINRTWESYEYESCLRNLFNKAGSLNDKGKQAFKKMIENGGVAEKKEFESNMRTISAVASMGELFGKTKKEKNDWKARMIKAGLGNRGLIMPEDWDELSEDEKEARLNAVIKQMKGND